MQGFFSRTQHKTNKPHNSRTRVFSNTLAQRVELRVPAQRETRIRPKPCSHTSAHPDALVNSLCSRSLCPALYHSLRPLYGANEPNGTSVSHPAVATQSGGPKSCFPPPYSSPSLPPSVACNASFGNALLTSRALQLL